MPSAAPSSTFVLDNGGGTLKVAKSTAFVFKWFVFSECTGGDEQMTPNIEKM